MKGKLKSDRNAFRMLLIICGCILTIIIIFIYYILPYAAKKIVQEVARRNHLGLVALDVRELSFFYAEIYSLVLGKEDNPSIVISSIDADYSPWSLLFDKKLDTVQISGAEINCSYDGKSLTFTSFDISKFVKKEQSVKEDSSSFIISSIRIRDSLLKINYKENLFIIPFELEYNPGNSWKEGEGTLNCIVRDQPIVVFFSFDKKTAKFTLKVKDADLRALYGFFPNGGEMSGLLSANIKGEVSLSPLKIKSLEASADLKEAKYYSYLIPLLTISAKGERESIEVNIGKIQMFNKGKEFIRINPFMLPLSIGETQFTSGTDLIFDFPAFSYLNSVKCNIEFLYAYKGRTLKTSVKSDKVFINLPKTSVELKELSSNWLFTKDNGLLEGDFTIGNITSQKFNLGSLKSKINLNQNAASFRAIASDVLLPELTINLNGSYMKGKDGLFVTQIDFNLPKYTLAIPYDLGAWFTQAKGIKYSGDFAAQGFIRVDDAGVRSGAKIKISESTIDYQIKNASANASGISFDIQLNDLIKLQSMPSQSLQIRKISLGSVTLENIYALFEIEAFKSILLEGVRGQWCGGSIAVQSVRINPEIKDHSFVLSCDRINLAKLLGQLNIGKAEGEGALNGTIPIIIKDDALRFENGFLYSTPGESGKIHLQGESIDSITYGIPDGTQQFDQLKLSQMALKDFDYDWVKFYLHSDDDDMIIQLQFYGKPAKPLPFIYKKEIGGFAKVDVNSPGSIFQGIKLDVNIRLPFNKLLWYNKKFQDYFKKQ